MLVTRHTPFLFTIKIDCVDDDILPVRTLQPPSKDKFKWDEIPVHSFPLAFIFVGEDKIENLL